MSKTKKILIGILIITVLLLGLGYAAIQNVTLNITGTITADPTQSNFLVKFTGTPEVSDSTKVTAAITDDTNATINVERLTAKGESVTAKYTVQNVSTDLSADLSVETTNSNEEYFSIDSKLAKTSIVAGEATTLTVTVELIKTPISTEETSTIGIQITAAPVQPGEEGTTGGGNNDKPEVVAGGPYLPSGFSWANEEHTEILDPLNNQYVWINVPRNETVYNDLDDNDEDDLYGDGNYIDTTNEDILAFDVKNLTTENLEAIETELKEYTATYRNGTDFKDEFYSTEQHGFTDADAYNAHKNKMLTSVFKNEGFYVGKYETGIPDTEPDVIDEKHEGRVPGSFSDENHTIVIQANAYPYNYVTSKRAQELASNMPSGEYTSSLMFGVQWDLILKHLEITEVATTPELNSDSTEWGNYPLNTFSKTNASAKYYKSEWVDGEYEKTSAGVVLLSTGAHDKFEKGGIYDLAGNVAEWTLEYSNDIYNENVVRGGNWYDSTGIGATARDRYRDKTSGIGGARDRFGFRVTLF